MSKTYPLTGVLMKKGFMGVDDIIGRVKGTISKYSASLSRDETVATMGSAKTADGGTELESFSFGGTANPETVFVSGSSSHVIFSDISDYEPVSYPLARDCSYRVPAKGGRKFSEAADIFANALPLSIDATGIVPTVRTVSVHADGTVYINVVDEGNVPISVLEEEKPEVSTEPVKEGVVEVSELKITDGLIECEDFSDLFTEVPVNTIGTPADDSDYSVVELDSEPLVEPVQAAPVFVEPVVIKEVEPVSVPEVEPVEVVEPVLEARPFVAPVTEVSVPEPVEEVPYEPASVEERVAEEIGSEDTPAEPEGLPDSVMSRLPVNQGGFDSLFDKVKVEKKEEDATEVKQGSLTEFYAYTGQVAGHILSPVPPREASGFGEVVKILDYDRDILFSFVPELIEDSDDLDSTSYDNNLPLPEDYLEGYDRRFAKWAGADSAKKQIADIESVKKQVVSRKNAMSRKARPRRSRRVGRR